MMPSSAMGRCGNGCAARYGTCRQAVPERLSRTAKKAPARPTGPARPAASTTPRRSSVAGSYKEGVTNTAMAVMLALVLTLSLVTPTWAMSSSSVATKGENNGITWEKVDNIKLPIKENAAVEEEAQQQYADTDVVRVSIVLSDPSTLDKGFSASDIASGSKKAMKYRDKLESKQDKMAKTISKKALDGQSLDVVWNLTLATNIISANVQYGQIEKIEKIKGVDSVLIETQYEPCVVKESETTDPNMATSSSMIGSSVAWADGYTGAGSKVAIIDTGADTDHPSLNGAAYSYAVKGLGITPVTAADYADKLEKLNALKKNGDLKASDLYVSAKIPFGFNYIDADLDVTHDNDKQGDHGSHVTGIAAGNRYIEQADGSFAPALDTALTQGVAPDAQVYTMKVFGKGGGAYDSDYMAAIEDAMILGCDSANLSLGSGNPGMAKGGSGDVLAGMLVSLLGLGLPPMDACCAAVWLHGRAGDLAAREVGLWGMTPSDLLDRIPAALREVTE